MSIFARRWPPTRSPDGAGGADLPSAAVVHRRGTPANRCGRPLGVDRPAQHPGLAGLHRAAPGATARRLPGSALRVISDADAGYRGAAGMCGGPGRRPPRRPSWPTAISASTGSPTTAGAPAMRPAGPAIHGRRAPRGRQSRRHEPRHGDRRGDGLSGLDAGGVGVGQSAIGRRSGPAAAHGRGGPATGPPSL